MKQIKAFSLFFEDQLGEPQTLHLPQEAQIVDFQVKDSVVYLFALVDINSIATQLRTFVIGPTGQQINADRVNYIGNFKDDTYDILHIIEIL